MVVGGGGSGAALTIASAPLLTLGMERLGAVVRRLRELPVAVEPAPEWATGIGAVTVPSSIPVAAATPTLALAPAPGPGVAAATAVIDRPTTSAPRTRTTPRSVKNGPPKAPRTRRQAPPAPLRAPTLPATAVPVMAEVAALDPAVIEAEAPSAEEAALAVAADVATTEAQEAATAAAIVATDAPRPRIARTRAVAPDLDAVAADASTPLAVVVAARAANAHKRWLSEPAQSVAVERARSTPAQRIGDDGERLAAIRLEELGWRIVARNVRLYRAEVDLLAIDPSDPPSLVLVEVRRRGSREYGLAEETVDHRKRGALLRAAGDLASRPVLPDGRRLPALPVRVDLIAIDRGPSGRASIRHHRGIEI